MRTILKILFLTIFISFIGCGSVDETWVISGQSNSVVWKDYFVEEISTTFPKLYSINQPYNPVHSILETKPGGAYSELGFYFGFYYSKNVDSLSIITNGVGTTTIACWQDGEDCFEKQFRPLIDSGISINGLVWWQGESDAHIKNTNYEADLREFFKTIRFYFGDIKIVLIELQQVSGFEGYEQEDFDNIRAAQHNIAESDRSIILVPTSDISDGDLHPADKRPFANRVVELLLK